MEPGTKQVALSNSDLTEDDNVFSVFGNPAGSGGIKNKKIGFFYSPSLFELKHLASSSIAFTQPTGIGNFSLGIMTFGFELFRENKINLGYSLKLKNDFFVGIGLLYKMVRIKKYGTNSQLNFCIGGIYNISSFFLFGFSVHNLLRFDHSPVDLPQIYNLGATYKYKNKGSINFALSKEIYFPISPRFGIEYKPLNFLSFQVGLKNEPEAYSCGIGIEYRFFRIGYAFDLHQILGFTHQVDLIITL